MVTRRMVVRAGAIAAVLGLGISGCGGGGQTGGGGQGGGGGGDQEFSTDVSGNLSTMGFNPSDEVGQSRADYTAEQLPELTIEMDTTNFDTQKFTAQAAAGNLPDLIQLDRAHVATFAANDLIMPIDACYEAHGVTPEDQYYEAPLNDVRYQESLYAVPQFFQPNAIIVNTRAAEAAGVSPEDYDTSDPQAFLETVEQASTVEGSTPVTLGFDGDIPGSSEMWLMVFGGGSTGENGEPTLDRPENVEALTWIKEVLDAQGGYEEVTAFKNTMDVFGAENQYVTDQVSAQSWAQWYVNVLADYADQVEIQGVPIRDHDGNSLAFAGGTAFAIPTGAQNPDAACAWALNMTSTEAWLEAGAARQQTVEEEGSINTGLFTGSPEADQQVREQYVTESDNEDFNQVISTYYEILPNNRSTGASPVGQQINQQLNNAVVAAMTGEKTPEQALADAQAAVMRDYEEFAQ